MKKLLRTILTSPLLHFLVLGLFAYAAYAHLKPSTLGTIQITTQTIDALVQQRESISQTPITPEQRQELIEGHIEEEILLREAYKRDFDKNDYRVRKQLLNLMRSSLTEVIPEPSVAQLRAFYDENANMYKSSPSISFEQVYFVFSSPELPKEPEQFIQELEQSAAPLELGEFTQMGNKFPKTSFQRSASLFGKPFAEALFEMPLNTWTGPIESFRGIHYARVTAHHEPEIPPFDAIESYLRTDYFLRKGRASQERKIEEMRKNYQIIVEGTEKQ